MRKIFIGVIILVGSLFLFSFVSMNKNGDIKPLTLKPYMETIAKENNIRQNVLNLIEIRQKIADRVIGNGISKTLLLEAIQKKDDKKIRQIIGMSEDEYNLLNTQLNEIKETIFKKFPDVQNLISTETECSTCEISKKSSFINSLPVMNLNNGSMITAQSIDKLYSGERQTIENASEVGNCQWVQYTACLLVCTAAGPILYWPCAFLCADTYCTSQQ
jgi:hypothetical protein